MKRRHAEDANDRDALRTYLIAACADEPELLATVLALAEADEVDLLRVVRDFRDNLSDREIRQRHGDALDERLRVIHRIYVECARQTREQSDRPIRARKCYEARMLGRRDNYQAMLDACRASIPAQTRQAYEKLVHCARDKVPFESLPARLGREALVIEEDILQLRQRFKAWTVARKAREASPAPGGNCDG